MKRISKLLVLLSLLWAVGAANTKVYSQEKALTLEDALSLAKQHNKALHASLLDSRSAREESKIAKAGMLPTLSASGSYSRYFDRQVIFMPGALIGNENEPVVDVAVGGKNVFNAYVSFHQPIIAESARRHMKGARINEAIQDVHIHANTADLHVNVASLYYQGLLMRESIALNKHSLSRNVQALKDSRSLFAEGKSLKVDTLQHFIAVENLKTTISHLENQYHVVLLELRRIMGMNQEARLILSDSLQHGVDEIAISVGKTAYREALENRPDIQGKRLAVEFKKNYVSQARAQRLPTLSLLALYQLQAQSDHRNLDSYRWPETSFVGVQATIPLFAGSRVNSAIRHSSIQLQKSQLELEDAAEKAKTEIITLESNLKEAVDRIALFEKTVEAAEINYRIISDRYKSGLSSRLELADSELALATARMNRINAIYNVKITKLLLDRASGQLRYHEGLTW